MGKQLDVFQTKKLEKILDEATEETVREILWKIENIFETAIDKFYADYNPLYYNRTYSTYLASSGYEDLFSSKNIINHGDFWEAGIEVGAPNIPYEPYRAKSGKNWVFPRTYEKGIHGLNSGHYFGKKKIRKFQRVKGKKTFEAIWRKGTDITKKKKYYEGNIKVETRIMQNMSPSPKGIVGKEFRALNRRKVVNKLFNDILDSKLSQL